ncbi:thermonuclease family protein [Seohaeicola sp. SP36]|uniref:thermonuclease family protein n=1 Tax=unclassified Seohaeicola TaxID=2641111 RepID=UPI00237A749C|nr:MULTISPECIES: thermonuclease family protein [unclassified Seohaeicola]MDD9707443.1 thermonuclease family protein [Seohaeicola sp. 4SK31]MDD9735582.1 thermonuclease family protein [Seohaeicola sp. SP36]
MLRIILRALFRGQSKQRKKRLNVIDDPPFRRERPHRSGSVKGVETISTIDVHSEVIVVESAVPSVSSVEGICYVVDGDTIRIGDLSLRLAGIDAPELDHPWGQKAKWELVKLCKGQIITAKIEPMMSYDRLVATCYLPDGRDLSAEMVRLGLALDWPKFSLGKYAHLEPVGIRKKHWKAAARQRGHMHVFDK